MGRDDNFSCTIVLGGFDFLVLVVQKEISLSCNYAITICFLGYDLDLFLLLLQVLLSLVLLGKNARIYGRELQVLPMLLSKSGWF